ncbi:MAG: hypothetical protein JNN09_03330 [Alphaproteobacteria bacterium]|nr:hypothetical protein [Alphaproteobacteria bacterium]
MGFLDTVFGDLNDGQPHGLRAGFIPAVVPSLLASGAVALGAPAGEALVVGAALVAGVAAVAAADDDGAAAAGVAGVAVAASGAAVAAAVVAFAAGAGGAVGAGVGAAFTAGAAFLARGYNPTRSLLGAGAGLTLGAALVFNVVSGLPQKQSKAPVAGPVPSTVKSDKGRCGRDFNPAVITDDPLGQKIYMIAAQVNCLSQPNP